MEVGRLKNHILCCLVCARTLTTEYTGNTHWLFCVADGKVVLAESMLNAVEGNEWLTCVIVLDNDLVALHHISVEAVERLAVSHHYVVGDINDVVDWTKTDYCELFLEPLR